MKYRIVDISSEHDNDICYIIKNVGVEFGAVGEGFGPGDDEVLEMSAHYNPKEKVNILSYYLMTEWWEVVVYRHLIIVKRSVN